MRTPPEVVVPDRISSRLDPSERICSSTRCCAPAPTAIITITAATPMMMPSMVSRLRSLFTASARIATRSRPRTFNRSPCRYSRGHRVRAQHGERVVGIVVGVVLDQVPVAEAQHARARSAPRPARA